MVDILKNPETPEKFGGPKEIIPEISVEITSPVNIIPQIPNQPIKLPTAVELGSPKVLEVTEPISKLLTEKQLENIIAKGDSLTQAHNWMNEVNFRIFSRTK